MFHFYMQLDFLSNRYSFLAMGKLHARGITCALRAGFLAASNGPGRGRPQPARGLNSLRCQLRARQSRLGSWPVLASQCHICPLRIASRWPDWPGWLGSGRIRSAGEL